MTAEVLGETVSEPRGPVAAGGQEFMYREHCWTDRGMVWEPVYEMLADLPAPCTVTVQRQGGLCDGDWGIDVDLRTDGFAVPPAQARLWAHAVLAAVALAERVASENPGPPPKPEASADELLDEALNYLCDARNTAVMSSVPAEVSELIRHSIAEAFKRIELVATA